MCRVGREKQFEIAPQMQDALDREFWIVRRLRQDKCALHNGLGVGGQTARRKAAVGLVCLDRLGQVLFEGPGMAEDAPVTGLADRWMSLVNTSCVSVPAKQVNSGTAPLMRSILISI